VGKEFTNLTEKDLKDLVPQFSLKKSSQTGHAPWYVIHKLLDYFIFNTGSQFGHVLGIIAVQAGKQCFLKYWLN